MHTELDAMQAQPTENQTNTTHSIELDAEKAQPKQAKKGTNTAAGQGSEEKSPRRKAARKETPAPTNGRAKTTQRRGAKGSSAQKNGTIRGQSSHEAQAERPKVAQKLRATLRQEAQMRFPLLNRDEGVGGYSAGEFSPAEDEEDRTTEDVAEDADEALDSTRTRASDGGSSSARTASRGRN